MGGTFTITKTNGLTWKEITKLKVCADDKTGCINDEKMLGANCWHFSVAGINADVEGDSYIWIDGLECLKRMVIGKK